MDALVASLQNRRLQSCDILELFDLLPKTASPRQTDGCGEYFAAGSFVHGGVVGLHRNTCQFAGAVQLICRFLRGLLKGAPFTAFTILDQCQSDLHIDSNNEPDSWNLIVPLSKFQGGHVWYQDDHGDTCGPQGMLGKVLRVDLGPQWLSATKHKHCTLPWTGRRCVLVAFSTRFTDRLKPQEVCQLSESGFTLDPAVSTGEAAAPLRPLVPPKLQDLLIIELCCGDASLSKACGKTGFQTLALDARPPAASSIRVIKFDLLDADALSSLVKMISHESDRIALIWARVPCGTTTRAKERPLPKFSNVGKAPPEPLRSDLHPDGFTNLVGLSKSKLETANLVFEAICDVLKVASAKGVRCVIENPSSSLFWATSWFRALKALSPHSHWVSFPMCLHGGGRPKHTSLWVSSSFLSSLQGVCPGESEPHHKHAPWVPGFRQGRLHSGRAQSSYPELFCQRVAGLLRQAVLKAGVEDDVSLHVSMARRESSTDRIPLGLQPRKAPRLLPEFGYFLHVVDHPGAAVPCHAAPKTAHFISRHLSTWGEVQAEKREPTVGLQCRLCEPSEGTRVEVFRFGVPLPPDKFLQRAVSVGHPHSWSSNLEPALKEVVTENISGDEVALAKKRLKFVAKWSARAKELEADEEKLHESLPEHIRKILKGKRLLLWQEMIEEYDLPDKNLVEDMKSGFPLSGWLPKSGAFPARVRQPEFSVDTLKHLANGLNEATRKKMELRQSPELELATWSETLAELQSGWIWEAPEPEEGLKAYARRFGLAQQGKIRVIDDCSCCGLNATVGTAEQFVVHAIDRMAAMLSFALEVSQDKGAPLCGRTYDLKSAYKQFPVASRDRDLLRMLVNRPGHDAPASVGVNALPFGAIGSVAAFLRVSNCVWMIGVLALRVIWTAFFDDYSVVSKSQLKKNVAFAVQSLFGLLGLTYAKEGKKAPEFSPVFNMLGLVVDLSQFEQQRVLIGHTNKRVSELKESLEQVVQENRLTAKTSERLRGRMNFFEGFSFGRGPNQALKLLDNEARSGSLRRCLSAEAVKAIGILKARLDSAVPLVIGLNSSRTWYLFTDGAFENGSGGVGAILYDEAGSAVGAFGSTVPRALMDKMLSSSKNPIYELELLPVLQAFRAWGKVLRQGQIVAYLDNESAKSALIRSCAATAIAEGITEAVRVLEESLQLRCWFSRVPSASNPADAPSRLRFEKIDPAIILDAGSLSWDVVPCAA